MAKDTLSFGARLQILETGKPDFDSDRRTVYVEMAGGEYSQRIQTVQTSEEAISISPNIGKRGFYVLHNFDDANFCTWGKTGELYNKLLPNEYAFVRSNLGGANLFIKADTAECRVEATAFED